MISHQAIGVDLPVSFGAHFLKRLQKALTIRIILKDWLTAVAAVHDVIDRAGIFYSELARHDASLRSRHSVSILKLSNLRD